MRIDRHVLKIESEQTIETHEYAKPLCVRTIEGAPSLWTCVDPNLPKREVRVRIVQQSNGPVPMPEFGAPPTCLAFSYVGSAFSPASIWHVFVET
jgi:hypothetical protein